MRLERLSPPHFTPGRDQIIDCDLDGDGRAVFLLQSGGTKRLAASGEAFAAVPADAASRLSTCRLLPDAGVLVAPVAEITDEPADVCAVVSSSGYEVAPFGVPHNLFTGGPWVFTTYSERVLLFTREPSHEDDIVTVFNSRTRERLLGLADLLGNLSDDPSCYEVACGCATVGGQFAFIGSEGASSGPHLWTLDPNRRCFRAVPPQPAMASADAVAALSTDREDALLMTVMADAVGLARIDTRTGRLVRWQDVPANAIRDVLGTYASSLPGGGWSLDAQVRGLDGGRFLLHTATQAIILTA